MMLDEWMEKDRKYKHLIELGKDYKIDYIEEEGSPVGFMMLTGDLLMRFIEVVYVVPERRSRGLGRGLVQDLQKRYDRLKVHVENDRSERFFKGLGFVCLESKDDGMGVGLYVWERDEGA